MAFYYYYYCCCCYETIFFKLIYRIKKKKKVKQNKSQSREFPGKLLLLGENETFLAKAKMVSCQMPLLLPNSLSSVSLILAGFSSQLQGLLAERAIGSA